MDIDACSAEGCDRQIHCRELCKMHYERMRRREQPCAIEGCDRFRVVRYRLCTEHLPYCTHPGCGRPRFTRWWCGTHYQHELQGKSFEIRPRVANGQGCLLPSGYRQIRDEHGKRVLEHRAVMAKLIGRPLTPSDIVKHRNGDKLDNRPENLILTSKAENA